MSKKMKKLKFACFFYTKNLCTVSIVHYIREEKMNKTKFLLSACVLAFLSNPHALLAQEAPDAKKEEAKIQ
ncbi:MAG: hypothetical protein LCH26_01025 [Proteobacteria bacterium]|nr:hypothetical protein [Pseudomonadota bacterium]